MSDLTTLDNERHTILLAEVSGLLHNIAKLDASFLLVQASDLADAQSKLRADGKTFDSAYQVRRLAQPPAQILRLARHEITTMPRRECREALIAGDYWTEDERTALHDYQRWQTLPTEEQQRNPPSELAQLTAARLGAAMMFNRLYRGSGPVWPDEVEAALGNTSLDVLGESWPLNGLLSLFWDQFHLKRGKYERVDALGHWIDRTTNLPRGLILAHGSISGAEKEFIEEEDEEQEGDEQERPKQKFFEMRLATAFGHEGAPVNSELLSAKRQDIGLSVFPILASDPFRARSVVLGLSEAFQTAIGDTRRPVNDVSLWDMSHPTASLFKAYLAASILQGEFISTATAKWRLLHLSFDGLGFLGRAHHVSDLLGRGAALDRALDAAQAMLETEFPVGNQVYRDEHGSIFVVADRPDLLHLVDADGTTLEQHVRAAFDQAGLHGELKPKVVPSSQSFPGQDLPLYQVIQERAGLQQPDPMASRRWWPAPGQPAPEICTVCGLRPVGYSTHGGEDGVDLANWATAEKATRRKVCRICLDRRGRRAQDWARNSKAGGEKTGPFQRTIWINEVADTNGRAALVVGHFDLRGWLDGRLIATLRKNSSFARIRRCWDTTQQFWEAVQTETIPTAVGQVACRLAIEVSNADDVDADLGDFHAYDWPLGHGVTLSVVWDPERRCFIAADNLAYLAGPGQLGRLKRPTVDQLRVLYTVNGVIRERGSVTVEEPSGYGQPRRTLTRAETPVPRLLDSAYVPTIPLLAEPATFMALVPADKAMAVLEAIRDKYATEMGRVRDRLPLHLGLVVFPRATPLRAVLDAGRALLRVASHERWEPWTVASLDPDAWDEANPPADGRRTITFDNGVTWHVPLLMGDGETPDQWYAHCLKVDPRSLTEIMLDQHLVHASQLQAGDIIWVRPSTFDYVFLDTTGRRFEIAYDADGRRIGQPGRPFDLEAVHDFPAVWQMLTGGVDHPRLKSSQLHGLLELARTKGGDWGSDNGAAVNRLLRDALLRAAWPGGWKKVPAGDRSRLLAAVEAGWLPDLLDFYLSVLKMEPTEEEVD